MAIALESTALILAVVLFVGILAPDLFKRFHLPYVSSLIIIGAILGPSALNYVQSNDILEFFGFMGSAFLMLMAGLEVNVTRLQGIKKTLLTSVGLNGLVPFIVGFGVVALFGYPLLSAVTVGIVFISSSVAIITSTINNLKLEKSKIGQTILSTVIIEDTLSLILLSIVFQNMVPLTRFPLPIYFGMLIFTVVSLKMFLPEFARYFLRRHLQKDQEYEGQLRFVIVLLFGVLVFFSGLGVHPLVASFLVGMILSDVITDELLRHKIHTFGYGLFVPVFFFIVGMKMDLSVFASLDYKNLIFAVLALSLILAKFFTGYLAGRISGFSSAHSKLFGAITTPQLTTTLAVSYAASEFQIIDSTLLTCIIFLSILTTIFAPVAVNYLYPTSDKQKVTLDV